MSNRIHHIWEAIEDEKLRNSIRHREQLQARAARRLMPRDDMVLSIQIISHQDPIQPTVHHFHTMLFLNTHALILLDSVRNG